MLNKKCSASVLLLPAVLSSALLLSACGGGGGEGGSSGGTSPTTSGGKTTQTNVSLSVSVTGSGQVTPMSKSLASGNSTTFTVKAGEGHLIESMTGCGGTLQNNTYTTDKISQDCQIETVFALKSFQITTSQSGEGNIYPESPVLDWGTEQTLTLSAATGYKVGKAYGCGGTLSGDKYSIPAVTAECEIQVEFHPLSLALKNDKLDQQVELNVKGNAGISPTSKGIIQPGEEGAPPVPTDIDLPFLVNDIDLTTELGATVELDIVYEKPLPEGIKYYKFGPAQPGAEDTWYALPQELYQISEDRKVVTLTLTDGQLGDADWENNGFIQDPGGPAMPRQHTVTVNASEGGTSSVTSSQVNNGDVAAIVLTPNTGYHIQSAVGCGGTLTGNTYNTGIITADCQVDVQFALNQYLMTSGSGEGGSITPAEQTVYHGESAQFMVQVQNGYTLENISGCDGTLQGQIFTTASATANCEVAASFSQQYFSVSTQVTGGGSITPDTVKVAYDGTTTLTVTPQTGHYLANIEGCGGQLSGDQYTTGPVTANCTVNAHFAQREYTVNATAGAGGQIDPDTQQVVHGNVASFNLLPQVGYLVDNVTGCSGTLSGNTYTTGAVTAACEVEASFKAAQYRVTASATSGGSISPNEQAAVHGQQVSFSVTANEGFTLESVSGCGGVLTESGFITAEITQSCHVSASFVAKQYEISATASEGGSISPAQQQVVHGKAVSFQVSTDTGYSLVEVTGCNGVLSGDVYTVGNVTGACNVHASFSLNHYEVTAVSSVGGALSPASQRIAHGQQATFSVAVEPGYNTVDIQGCGGQLIDGQFVTAPITQSCQISANFDQNSYAVTTKVSGNGSVSPASQFVLHGESASLTLTPDAGQKIASVSGCEGVLDGNVYTTAPVMANCEVAVAFSAQQFMVEAQASEGGQISPAQQMVSYADSMTFTVTPDEGFSIDAVEGCEGSLTGNLYTTKPIMAACLVSAKFVRTVYPVTALASEGGVVTPAQQNVEHGQSATFELQPEAGHSIVSVTGCEGSQVGTTYVTGPITAACEVVANFDANKYSVTTQATEGGSLTPASQLLSYGAVASVEVSVEAGFLIESVTGCGGALSGSTYTTAPIVDNCQISASFVKEQFEVSVADFSNGQVSPRSQQVTYAERASFVITPDVGFEIVSVTGCGGLFAKHSDVYTTGPITQSCQIDVETKRQSFHVATNSAGGGTISPQAVEVDYDNHAQFTITPDEGFVIDKVSGCGGTLTGQTYTTGAVYMNCEVVASFIKIKYVATAQASSGGTITPPRQEVESGLTATFSVTPDAGFWTQEVTGCNGTLIGNEYTTGPMHSDCSVKAKFEPNQYVVDVSVVGSNMGSVFPMSQQVLHGERASVTVSPNSNVSFWPQGCGATATGNVVTTAAVTQNCTIKVNFNPISMEHSVTTSSNSGGVIFPTHRVVLDGERAEFDVTPSGPNFQVASVTGCGGALNGHTYTTAPIFASCNVHATFEQATYRVSATSGTGGAITPASSDVSAGGTVTLTVTPDAGYQIDAVTGCAGRLTGNTYTTGAVTANCTVSASFSLKTLVVSASAGSGGRVTPATQTVKYGEGARVWVYPDEGHKVTSVTGCGGSYTNNLYTIDRVTASCNVVASFATNKLIVTGVSNEGGSLSPASQEVNKFDKAQLTVSIDDGYFLKSITGCYGSLSGSTYTTGALLSNCTVTAEFGKYSYTVNATATDGGSISPAQQNVEHGNTASFTLTPVEGYSITGVNGCGGKLTGNTYTTAQITASCNVSASFSKDTFLVTATAESGGAISPASFTAAYGDTVTLQVTPNEGYEIESVLGCNGQLNGQTYTTGTITSSCQVTAKFNGIKFEVTASATTGGSVTPTSLSVDYNARATFQLTPEQGYIIKNVSGCTGTLTGNVFTTEPLKRACSLSVEFMLNLESPSIAVDTSDSTARITWQPVAGADSYTLFYAKQPGLTPQNYDTLRAGTRVANVSSGVEVAISNYVDYYVMVTANHLGNENAMSNEVTARSIARKGKLNDTGQQYCSTTFADQTRTKYKCGVYSGYELEGQDGFFGRDAKDLASELPKVGFGMAGFDLTKIDSEGNPLPNSAEHYACLRDNYTGLMWEVKQSDKESLHYYGHRYSWYNPDYNTNGGYPGVQNGGTCAGSACDYPSFVEAVNTAGLCGAKDWRMPSNKELLNIFQISVESGRNQTGLAHLLSQEPDHQLWMNIWTELTSAKDPQQAWRSSGSSYTFSSTPVQMLTVSKTHNALVLLVRDAE
ncbi:InlB B-repeat-containing protein [Pseudoalteromonas rubra]|uniref:Fibronectin type-III domain-containing protein n=1 Tax=Pseudoalteromonas rubra TaxID=43658 RepID=A0A5S3X3P6_9GAMM|nr:choice-of-anchor U domain-containing protein [Pseudoalteromonas rubra]TMP38254.1 hypothetical protein CWB98_07150 [Pseudoalteromonas rubra]